VHIVTGPASLCLELACCFSLLTQFTLFHLALEEQQVAAVRLLQSSSNLAVCLTEA